MKPTAVLLTVLMLVTASLLIGGSFNTKNKEEAATPGCNILPEIPLKKENIEPPPPPDNKPGPLPTIVEPEPVGSEVGMIENTVHTIGCDLLPSPILPPGDVKEKDDSDELLTCDLTTEAEYPGGAAAWQRYLNRNMRFSEIEIDNEIQGSVVVKFAVDSAGNVCDVEAVSGPEVLCAEVMRVIKKSGKWRPATQSGRSVKSLKKQPIVICLESEG